MRRLLILVPFLLAAPLCAQQKVNRRIAIASDASIRITNLAGTTRVSGWDRDSIAVTGMAPAGTDFFMGGAGRGAKMGLEPDEKGKAAEGGLLEVLVPRGARVWVRSAGGSIEVKDLSGEVDLSSVGGGIRVSGTLRIVTAESIEGDVEIIGPSPVVRVKTGGGKILLRESRGDLTASTVSGPIVANGAQAASARLETISGSVSYVGTVDQHGTLNIQTHSGDVELYLPASIGAEFDLESPGGGVIVALSGKLGKPVKGKSVFFASGGGGAQVVVRSFKGAIRIFGQ